MSEAMDAEFDTVAEWTAEAAARLGEEFFLPAACRGSGSPSALDWLVDALELQADDVLFDSGAGVGGPAAYARQSRGVGVLLAEPEAGACRASARLFGLPVVQASGTALPVADQGVDAAWSLGVLCTMEDQLGLLSELRRIVRPPGRVGMLVYLATTHIPDDQLPEGNHFPTTASLEGLFGESGFTVVAQRSAADLDSPPADWERRMDRVDAEIKRLHAHEEAWQVAERQSEAMADLVTSGAVSATLFSLRTTIWPSVRRADVDGRSMTTVNSGPPGQGPNRHTVLADIDSGAYHSLRQRPVTRAERYALGKSLRKRVPRRTLADWEPRPYRPDPVQLIEENHRGRLERLIPVRVGRMIASPYGFLRGTAVVMADDVAHLPSTGITPVVCGDSHLGNFGFYASPERDLVIDLNDFDEAHPGGWEWDLRRLVASIWVAGRFNGATEDDCGAAVRSCVSAYRMELRRLADQPLFSRSFTRLDVDRLAGETAGPLADEVRRSAARARNRTSDRALPRFTKEVDGVRRIVEEPPLITRVPDDEADALAEALDDYLPTLSTHWRRVLGGYTLLDVAHKVVGVGSVGLRAYVALLEGSSPEDVVFLQLKQARRSVLARHVHGESAWHAHQGQRVVEYQQALQTVSDPLLGWTTVYGRQYYVRQFRNMKGTIPLDAMDPQALIDYTGVVGQLLAKGHARTSGASMIAGYLGRSEKVDDALTTFARRYADQTEADHAALVAAVDKGRLPVERGA